MKPMPPPDIPPSIQKPQKASANSARTRPMRVSVKQLLAQGIIRWMGPKKLRVVSSPICCTCPACSDAMMSSRICLISRRDSHSAAQRSRYFSVTISRIGPTFWAMPPWTSTRLSWSWRRVSGEASG